VLGVQPGEVAEAALQLGVTRVLVEQVPVEPRVVVPLAPLTELEPMNSSFLPGIVNW
jgi:hypothetical protein